MDVEQLKANLAKAIEEGYDNYVVYFMDQDNDAYSIATCYLDDDGDVCLECQDNGDDDYSADELLEQLEQFDDDLYVYIYDVDNDMVLDINEEENDYDPYDDLWYIDDETDLCMDVTYDEEDDDEEEEDGDAR